MKYTSVDQYAKHIHESIALAILKRLFAKKIRPALNQATDLIMNDPELDEKVEQLKQATADVEKQLDLICFQNPDHFLCKDRKNRRR